MQVVSNAVGCPSAPERPHNSHINPPSTHQRRTAYSRDAPHYDSRLHPQLAHQQPESYRERPMQQGDAVQYINPSNPVHAPQQGSRQEARYAAYGPPVACPQQDHPSRQSTTSQYVGQPVAYPQQNQLSGPVNQYGGQFNAPPAHQSFQEQQSHHHRQWGQSSIPQQSVQQGQLPTSSGGFHPGGQSNTVLTRDTFQGSSQLPPYAQDTQPRNIQSAVGCLPADRTTF